MTFEADVRVECSVGEQQMQRLLGMVGRLERLEKGGVRTTVREGPRDKGRTGQVVPQRVLDRL